MDSVLFAGTEGAVYDSGGLYRAIYSDSSWTPWIRVNSGMVDYWGTYAFAIIGKNLFAGTNGGPFRTTDYGDTWDSTDLNYWITAFAVCNGYLFAARTTSAYSSIGTVWRRPISDFAAVLPSDPHNSVQTKLRIVPSGSDYQLTYTLQSPSFVEISFFTVSGKKVSILEQGYNSAGEHSVRFNSGTLPVGMYVYKFKAGSYEENGRVMVTKR
jgi:hypothetical protein